MEYKVYSVSKFAELAKINKQTAYNLLKQEEYSRFIIEENGIKKVSAELLEVLEQKKQENKGKTIEREKSIDSNIKETKGTADIQDRTIEELRQEIQELKEQIRLKDNTIADFALKFAELAQEAQNIAGRAQILQANEKKQLSKTIDENNIEYQQQEYESKIIEQEQEIEIKEPEKSRIKEFFKNLFS